MSSRPLLQVQNLSKEFRIFRSPLERLLHMTGISKKSRGFRSVNALTDISFDIFPGEAVGIMGVNGSGKSTLLQLITGTLAPSAGSIVKRGRIAALLELGSGFNLELSGRENVLISGLVLGMAPKEIADKFDDIVAFADIGRFIDDPVKTYSSGMMLRLAFAVHAQIEPDLLIVDEALAVGDAKFQAKCFERLRRLKENGCSILFVTHMSEQIASHCERAILLNRGELVLDGKPREIINNYMSILFNTDQSGPSARDANCSASSKNAASIDTESSLSLDIDRFHMRPGYNKNEYRWGDRSAEILDYVLVADQTAFPPVILSGQSVTLNLTVKFVNDVVMPIFGIAFKTVDGITVYGTNSEQLSVHDLRQQGRAGAVVKLSCKWRCLLAPGEYFISFGVATRSGEGTIPHDRRYDAVHITVASEKSFHGLVDLRLDMKSKNAF